MLLAFYVKSIIIIMLHCRKNKHTLEQMKSLVPEGLTTLMFEAWMSEQTCE